mmetsp:Transcript_47272/g.48109  ORF Transcript_47272/g.48109 Transcript_47272/m.48109 type:complete len:126 (+) Transcript_47272:1380-1757(+)
MISKLLSWFKKRNTWLYIYISYYTVRFVSVYVYMYQSLLYVCNIYILHNNNNNTVTSTLTQQQVPTAASSVSAVTSSAVAAAGSGNDPHKLLDDIAESLLDGPYTVLPAKQKLFAGVKPMVENLL